MFLKNHWYAVAWDHEVKRTALERTVCEEPIVLYRQVSGALSVFEDCCPHRLLPLSKGYLKGDHLVCRYYGLEFNECGQCMWMPGQQGVHKGTHLKTYPVLEKHHFVWVWIGDTALADASKIPDLPWCSDPNWIFDYLYKSGIPAYRATTGNRGAWVLRRTNGDVTHFITLSFWESRDAIVAFAGDGYRRR